MPRRFFIGAVIAFIVLSGTAVQAQEAGITDTTSVSLTVSSLPEAQLTISEHIIFPLLRGSGPLTSGNNLDLGIIGNVTPISLDGTVDLTLTPIAFLQVIAGTTLGSGWNMFLGNGLGLNVPTVEDGNIVGKIEGDPFDGLIWKMYWAGLFQFDLAAIIPGDWNHVVVQTRQEWNYQANTNAAPDDSWIFKADDGENRNGFNYYASYVLGYQMPASPVVKMVAMMAEMDLRLYDKPENRSVFGDDKGRWTISSLVNFQFNDWLSTNFIIQLRTLRNYTDDGDLPQNKKNKPYYQTRQLYTDDPLRLDFYRFVAILSFKLR
ncbi:hypothetical protein AGMMS50267_00400 [Spirochaetia bacterium]|nr:hypothetical protein AGMMS50267_00400 [Spirochaetia bacterium]